MKLLILQIVIFGLATAVLAEDLQNFSITTNQAAEVKQKLDAYENGKLTLQDLNENAGAEGWRELVGYYLLHTNEITTKAKLPISRAFAGFNLFSNAINLGTEYVNVYSNDWHGWRLLGAAYDSINSSNESIRVYSNDVKFGGKDAYETLAGVAIKNDRLDVVQNIVPRLMILKSAKQTPEEDKLNLISILLFYSIKTDRKDIFTKTLDGVDMKEVLQNDEVKKDIVSGCAYFEDEDTNKDIEKIRQEMESATGSTNSVSSPPR